MYIINIQNAETHILHAITLSSESQYYRTLADVNLLKINILLNQQGVSQEILQNQFRTFLASAQGAAQSAVNVDRTDYQNWLSLGKVYESVVPSTLKVRMNKPNKPILKHESLTHKIPQFFWSLPDSMLLIKILPKQNRR